MINASTRIRFLSITLSIILILGFFSSAMSAQKGEAIEEIREKLDNVSQEEIEILESLFIQAQEMEELKREKLRLTDDIDMLGKEVKNLEELIHKETVDYENKLGLLGKILKSYQRMGPSTYIQIILDSDSIADFLRRINILRDLTKNTGDLLEAIEKSREKLSMEKSNLDERLNNMRQRESQLNDNLNKSLELIKDMEEYLNSLEGDKMHYEERLKDIVEMMNRVGDMISDIAHEFSNIIEKGNLPDDGVRLQFTPRGTKGIIDEKVFNDIIQSSKSLPEIKVNFKQDRVEMEMPQANLILTGNFYVVDDYTIGFKVDEGKLYSILLTKSTIDDFFKGGYFTFNLKPLIGRNIIQSIETKEGYVEIGVKINLF